MVCRTWCDAMDHWYQNQQFRYYLYHEAVPEARFFYHSTVNINRFVNDGFEMESPENLEFFLPHFESSHSANGVAIRNPFVGRFVSLFIGGWDDEEEEEQAGQFMDRIQALFLKYGRYVWYLEINFMVPFFTQVECYSTVRTLLQSAPNLKILHVSFEPENYLENYRAPIISAAEVNQLEAYINTHPLPRLERLEFLKTKRYSEYIPPPVFRELIRTNGHVPMLEFDSLYYHLADYNISSVAVPNLTKLSLTIRSEEEFERFCASDNQWLLSKLALEFEGSISVGWDRIFRELEVKWAETLSTLILQLPHVEGTENQNRLWQEAGNFRLNLPRLAHLKLIMPNLSCLDFLLPMKDSLEVLDLVVFATVQRLGPYGLVKRFENGKVVQLLKNPHRPMPMDSNIWSLFPKLKRLRLDFRLESGSEVRRDALDRAYTRWSVSRHLWQVWGMQSSIYRRKKSEIWKIKRWYH